MKLLTGSLLAGAVCLSILTGCSGADASDGSSDSSKDKTDSRLKDFAGTWLDKETDTELKVKDTGKVSLTAWDEEAALKGKLTADNTDGVATFDATGRKGVAFHFVVEFRNEEDNRIYLHDTNKADVPPQELAKQ